MSAALRASVAVRATVACIYSGQDRNQREPEPGQLEVDGDGASRRHGYGPVWHQRRWLHRLLQGRQLRRRRARRHALRHPDRVRITVRLIDAHVRDARAASEARGHLDRQLNRRGSDAHEVIVIVPHQDLDGVAVQSNGASTGEQCHSRP